jgi:hypothetical protein
MEHVRASDTRVLCSGSPARGAHSAWIQRWRGAAAGAERIEWLPLLRHPGHCSQGQNGTYSLPAMMKRWPRVSLGLWSPKIFFLKPFHLLLSFSMVRMPST